MKKTLKINRAFENDIFMDISFEPDNFTNIIYQTPITQVSKTNLNHIYYGIPQEDYFPSLRWCNKHDITTSNNITQTRDSYLTQKIIFCVDYHRAYILNYFKLNNIEYDKNFIITYYKNPEWKKAKQL